MKAIRDVANWMAGAAQQFSDPAEPVCQLFFRWWEAERPRRPDDEELVCMFFEGELQLLIDLGSPPIPLPVVAGEAQIKPPSEPGDEPVLEAYGAELITASVWAITPSLYMPGVIHGFVVLYDVPDPAPWVRRIVLPAGVTV